MQNLYYVSHEGKEEGPMDLLQIAEQVKAGHFAASDYLFDESKQDWVLLMEYSPLNEYFKDTKPEAPPKSQPQATAAATTPTQEEWYILKWDNRYGPFTFLDVVKMLQDKSIFEFDYVWKPSFESWQRVAEVAEFNPDKIRGLKDSVMPELSEVFFRRRHVRTKYNGSIIVHDNITVWKGESIEVSEGGAGIVMHNALVLPGQKIFLHFKPGDGVPPFNATCEVVSKQYVKGIKNKDAPVGYGIKFIEINGDVQEAIRNYTTRVA